VPSDGGGPHELDSYLKKEAPGRLFLKIFINTGVWGGAPASSNVKSAGIFFIMPPCL
jgi:hypothetical protein